MRNSEAVIIGMGNEFRTDDAAGLIVARTIQERLEPGIRIVEGVSEGSALMDAWKDARVAIIIDSVTSGAEPGYIYKFDALKDILPEEYFRGYSTHAFSVAQTVQLARTLKVLPGKLVVYGIEGANFTTGTKITPEVLRAVERLTEIILNDIKSEILAEEKQNRYR